MAPLPPSPALYPMASGLPSFWFTLSCLQNIPGGPAPQTTQQYWHTLTSQRLSLHTSCLRWDSNRDSPSVPQASMRPGPDCSPWKSVTPKSTSLVTVWHRHHQLTATSLPPSQSFLSSATIVAFTPCLLFIPVQLVLRPPRGPNRVSHHSAPLQPSGHCSAATLVTASLGGAGWPCLQAPPPTPLAQPQ